MKRIIGPRASTLLYNALLANRESYGKGRFILPANVCPIVPVTFLKAGIQVEFLDIDFKSQCISEFHLLSRVKSDSGSIAGVLFVHSYGSKQNTSDIFAELKEIKKELFLIDDYCIGIPEIGTNQQNNSADLILYSTGYAKFVEFGYGGFGYLNDRAAYYMIDGVYE